MLAYFSTHARDYQANTNGGFRGQRDVLKCTSEESTKASGLCSHPAAASAAAREQFDLLQREKLVNIS
jgi:hypothetical protein